VELLYKYREFSENTDKIIINAELYFASHDSFNDPFDCNLEFKESSFYSDKEFEDYCLKVGKVGIEKEEYLIELREKLIKAKLQVGILCMCQDDKNILMWSHYAKNHKGLCFGFECGFYDKKKIIYDKVIYPENEEYELVSFFNEQNGEIRRMFTTKSKFWKYEQEIRLIDLSGGKTVGTKKFNREFLKEIIFGYKADETNIKKIIQLCQLNGFEHVVFKKARIVSGRFELDFDDIDKTKYL